METPVFKSREEEIAFVVKNKHILIAEKCMTIKTADAIFTPSVRTVDINDETKALNTSNNVSELMQSDKIQAQVVINTTKILDSHGDVHLDGLWKKSLQENKNLFLLQEHVMSFKNIISDEVKASTKSIPWSDLGFKYDGETQALVFDVAIEKDRNPFMFEQYAKGYVKNHSVGMRYIKMSLAVNDANYKAEKATWDKYISQVVNIKEAEDKGYFWAIQEAKAIEGSAVPIGSNIATPTMSVEAKDIEPSKDTQNEEPLKNTQENNTNEKKPISIYF